MLATAREVVDSGVSQPFLLKIDMLLRAKLGAGAFSFAIMTRPAGYPKLNLLRCQSCMFLVDGI